MVALGALGNNKTATTARAEMKRVNLIVMSTSFMFLFVFLGSLSLLLMLYLGGDDVIVDCAGETNTSPSRLNDMLCQAKLLLSSSRAVAGGGASTLITAISTDGLSTTEQDLLPVSILSYSNGTVLDPQQDFDDNDFDGQVRMALGKVTPPQKMTAAAEAAVKDAYNTVVVIGDLHSDVKCTKFWVEKSNLIQGDLDDLESSSQWTWKDINSRLVFMGDYIDKGPQAFQVLQLVKALHLRFPDYVFPLLGNHELEVLLDRKRNKEFVKFYEFPSSYAHPAEFLNWVSEPDIDLSDAATVATAATLTEDKKVLDTIYDLLLKNVYVNQGKGPIEYDSDLGQHGKKRAYYDLTPRGDNSITKLITDDTYKEIVSTKLEEWQTSYINSFASDTELGNWLEQLPIFVILADTIFVHGGINEVIINRYLQEQDVSVNLLKGLNDLFHLNAKEDKINDFFDTDEGKALMEGILLDRSLHEERGGKQCAKIKKLVNKLGVSRIGVGHTPHYDVRTNQCFGQTFLALDSGLGRWFRMNGNNYCKGFELEFSAASLKSFKCKPIKNICEGQIIKMTKKGAVFKKRWKIEMIEGAATKRRFFGR